MNEEPEDTVPSSRLRTADLYAAVTRVEATLNVFVATQTVRQEPVDRRLADHDAALANLGTTLAGFRSDLSALKAAAETTARVEAESRPKRTDTATWISLGISILIALYLVIDHTPSP